MSWRLDSRRSPRAMSDRSDFRQLLGGLDFAVDDRIAEQMVNFVYAIGDRETGEAMLVDPAYEPAALVDLVEADGLHVVGAIATHYHADHVGGSLGGQFEIAGIASLLERVDVPIHVQSAEFEWVNRCAGRRADCPRTGRRRSSW